MNQDIKKEWITALKSGKYKQARHRLKVGDSFCCLGVLCDISKLAKWEADHTYLQNKEGKSEKGATILPNEVMEWAGLKTNNVRLTKYYTTLTDRSSSNVLSGLNDMGYTFEQIADIIEKEL